MFQKFPDLKDKNSQEAPRIRLSLRTVPSPPPELSLAFQINHLSKKRALVTPTHFTQVP